MIYLITILITLTLAGSAGAEVWPLYEIPECPNRIPPDYGPSSACKPRKPPDPCLATMREAMKAMDWYLPRGLRPMHGDRWQSYMQLSEAGHEAVEKALKQWDAAKACWRETP